MSSKLYKRCLSVQVIWGQEMQDWILCELANIYNQLNFDPHVFLGSWSVYTNVS